MSDLNQAQPAPTGTGDVVLFEAMKLLIARADKGLGEYRTFLRTQNGRDAHADMTQELADALMYAVQFDLERKAPAQDADLAFTKEIMGAAYDFLAKFLAGHVDQNSASEAIQLTAKINRWYYLHSVWNEDGAVA